LDEARATTDDEGRFEIRSAERVRGLRVAPTKRSYFEPEPIYAEPGRTDLRLVLYRGLTLEGSVLLDEGVPSRTILAEYFGASPRPQGLARVGADGRFSLASLPSGSGSIVLNLHGAVPLLRVDGIEIGRDSALAPECLRDLDLRGKIRAMNVRCIEGDNAPLARARIELADLVAPQQRFPAELDAEGRARLWLPDSWESFWLVVEGYAPVSLTWSAEECVVRLDSRIRIVLELAPDVALHDGLALSVAIGFPKSSPFSVLEKAAVPKLPQAISPQQLVKLNLPLAGNYEINWTLRSATSERELRFATTQLHVQSANSEQTLRVAPPADALERVLATFR
jgi:hypothetical protein